MNKVSNYNVRYCNIIDLETMEIDLTPAELKKSFGKVLYIIPFIYEDYGVVNLKYYYMVSAELEEDGYRVNFAHYNGLEIKFVLLTSTNDDSNFKAPS